MTATQLIVTPSAKAHERVKSRWDRDITASGRRDWISYGVKIAVGTPIPWLMLTYAILGAYTRAGVEIAAWTCAGLNLLYILADRLSGTREFGFFRVGGDFFLFGLLVLASINAAFSPTMDGMLTCLGSIRWIGLFYLMAYCWELFPGLNRIFTAMIGSCLLASLYSIFQHYTGVDLLGSAPVQALPVTGRVLFIPQGFFGSPEISATLAAIMLPFPAAAFVMNDFKSIGWKQWLLAGAMCIFVIVASWSYMPGVWLACIAALLSVVIMTPRPSVWRAIKLVLLAGAIMFALVYESFGSFDAFSTSMEQTETLRGNSQRQQINAQVKLWEESPWIGTGSRAMEVPDFDAKTGNIYFQILASFGVLGLSCYFLFILGFLLSTYRIFKEIPSSHLWHRILISGALASQVAFHVIGLYSCTLSEGVIVDLYILIIAAVSYIVEHYSRGLVTDDHSL